MNLCAVDEKSDGERLVFYGTTGTVSYVVTIHCGIVVTPKISPLPRDM